MERPGNALDCGLLARRRWLELGRQAGLEVLQAGSLVLARHDDELEVLAGVAREEERAARLIGPEEAARLAPVPTDGVRGALHATLDLRVDPRQAVARLSALLEQDPGARVIWGAHVQAAEPGRIEAEQPELVAHGVRLIVAQLPGGDLIIGDSHDYADTPAPFACEWLDRLILAEACRLLGADCLDVRERWQGMYPFAPGDPFMVTEPLPGVRVVEVVSGIGMTTALGLAPQVLSEMVDGVSSGLAPSLAPYAAPAGAPPPSAAAHADCGP